MTKQISEKQIEQYLRGQIHVHGGKAYKFTSPGNAGVPDRLILLPHGKMWFVECKAPGCTSTPLQKVQQNRIRALGFNVGIVDSYAAVDALLREMLK